MSSAGWIVIGFLFICPFIAAETTGDRNATRKLARQPRSLFNLAAVVFEVTRHDPLDFIEYGNWCGKGGSGDAVDAIDMCCVRHDACYDIATKGACTGKNSYKYPYDWSVTKDDRIICDTVDPCGEILCACDKMVADCFKEHEKSYNPENHKFKLELYPALMDTYLKLISHSTTKTKLWN